MSAPVNLVNLERVSKAHGTTVLLDDVSLGVAAGERIGIVGRNGGGKTTLLEVLTGREDADSGRVTRRSDLAMGVLEQTVDLPEGDDGARRRPADVAVRRRARVGRRRRRPQRADGLELDRLGLDAPVDAMSGGERRRVALAAQLIRPLDLLVLDEPTNHLDVEGVAWLADYVKSRGRRARGRHPRPLVPRRGVHDDLGGRRRRGALLRGRLRGLHAGPRRAHPHGRGHRGAPAEPDPQGARLAAPRAAGAHQQAAVPHRGGAGADRRRAAAARLARAGRLRRQAARARPSTTSRTSTTPIPTDDGRVRCSAT